MYVMKRLGAVALILLLAVPALAQDADQKIGIWQKDVELGVNILAEFYSKNWNGGDKGSVVWTGVLDAKLEKQFNEKTNWRNVLKLAYGQTHQQERDASGDLFWPRPDKTDDMIDFESMFRWTPENGWDPFVAFKFTSMFSDQSDAAGRTIGPEPEVLQGERRHEPHPRGYGPAQAEHAYRCGGHPEHAQVLPEPGSGFGDR